MRRGQRQGRGGALRRLRRARRARCDLTGAAGGGGATQSHPRARPQLPGRDAPVLRPQCQLHEHVARARQGRAGVAVRCDLHRDAGLGGTTPSRLFGRGLAGRSGGCGLWRRAGLPGAGPADQLYLAVCGRDSRRPSFHEWVARRGPAQAGDRDQERTPCRGIARRQVAYRRLCRRERGISRGHGTRRRRACGPALAIVRGGAGFRRRATHVGQPHCHHYQWRWARRDSSGSRRRTVPGAGAVQRRDTRRAGAGTAGPLVARQSDRRDRRCVRGTLPDRHRRRPGGQRRRRGVGGVLVRWSPRSRPPLPSR